MYSFFLPDIGSLLQVAVKSAARATIRIVDNIPICLRIIQICRCGHSVPFRVLIIPLRKSIIIPQHEMIGFRSGEEVHTIIGPMQNHMFSK